MRIFYKKYGVLFPFTLVLLCLTSLANATPWQSWCPTTISCAGGQISDNFGQNPADWNKCTCNGGSCVALQNNQAIVNSGGHTLSGNTFTYYKDYGSYAASKTAAYDNEDFDLATGGGAFFACGG